MKIRPKCPTQFCFQFSGTCSLTSDKFLHFPLISFASRNQIRLPISAINFDSFTENKGLLFFSLLNVHFVGVNLLFFTGVTPPTPPPPHKGKQHIQFTWNTWLLCCSIWGRKYKRAMLIAFKRRAFRKPLRKKKKKKTNKQERKTKERNQTYRLIWRVLSMTGLKLANARYLISIGLVNQI